MAVFTQELDSELGLGSWDNPSSWDTTTAWDYTAPSLSGTVVPSFVWLKSLTGNLGMTNEHDSTGPYDELTGYDSPSGAALSSTLATQFIIGKVITALLTFESVTEYGQDYILDLGSSVLGFSRTSVRKLFEDLSSEVSMNAEITKFGINKVLVGNINWGSVSTEVIRFYINGVVDFTTQNNIMIRLREFIASITPTATATKLIKTAREASLSSASSTTSTVTWASLQQSVVGFASAITKHSTILRIASLSFESSIVKNAKVGISAITGFDSHIARFIQASLTSGIGFSKTLSRYTRFIIEPGELNFQGIYRITLKRFLEANIDFATDFFLRAKHLLKGSLSSKGSTEEKPKKFLGGSISIVGLFIRTYFGTFTKSRGIDVDKEFDGTHNIRTNAESRKNLERPDVPGGFTKRRRFF